MRSDARWIVVFVGNAAFLFLAEQLNHYLTAVPLGHGPVQIHVFLLGLPVAFCALRLNLKQGLAAVIPTALFAEAGLPLPPGLLTVICATCFCVTIAVRATFNRFATTSALIVVAILNLLIMVALTIAVLASGNFSAGRLVADITFSELFVVFLTGWFFSAQQAAVAFFGYSLETELREPL